MSRRRGKPGSAFLWGRVSLLALHLVSWLQVCARALRPHAGRSRPSLTPRPPSATDASFFRDFIPFTLTSSGVLFFTVPLYQYLVSKYLVSKLLFLSCLARTLHPNESLVNSFIHHRGSRPRCKENHLGSLKKTSRPQSRLLKSESPGRGPGPGIVSSFPHEITVRPGLRTVDVVGINYTPLCTKMGLLRGVTRRPS